MKIDKRRKLDPLLCFSFIGDFDQLLQSWIDDFLGRKIDEV